VSESVDTCLFCHLVREGDHLRTADGFVAIPDINPQAEIHILVVPERHIDTFRDIAEFPAAETKRMLDFIAATAAELHIEDYKVLCNVGQGAGQTVFHLHWHLLAGPSMSRHMPAVAFAEAEHDA
jgi:histidine triad (HIT) family protein